MKGSSHITLGSVCYRLKDAKFFARKWTRNIEDPMWATATRLLLLALMRKLKNEKGNDWDLPDLRLLAESSRQDLIKVLNKYQPDVIVFLDSESRMAQSLMISVQSALSGLAA